MRTRIVVNPIAYEIEKDGQTKWASKFEIHIHEGRKITVTPFSIGGFSENKEKALERAIWHAGDEIKKRYSSDVKWEIQTDKIPESLKKFFEKGKTP